METPWDVVTEAIKELIEENRRKTWRDDREWAVLNGKKQAYEEAIWKIRKLKFRTKCEWCERWTEQKKK